MAVVNADLPTLADQLSGLDPDGAVAQVVEALTRRNPVLQDMVVLEGNLTTGHQVTTRTGLPSVGWRKYNEGITTGKSRKGQFTEAAGQLEGMSAVDVKLARLGGNETGFRASEDLAFVQALNNEISTGVFYHSTKTAPEKFLGLSPRLDSSSVSVYGATQIVSVSADDSTNDNTSIWGVVWSPEAVFGIYPKGSRGGIEPDDMGKQIWTDSDGKRFRAWVTHWSWDFGLVVKDARQIVRVANIDTSSLSGTDDTIVPAMISAYYRIQDPTAGRFAWYCNRKIAEFLHLQARNATKQSTIRVENIDGQPVTYVMGAPVRVTDAITNTEAQVA
jgi:hypothetical protein